MNNNQNVNNSSPFGMLNQNQTVPPVQNNNVNTMVQNTAPVEQSQPPVAQEPSTTPTPVQSTPANNQNVVTLGTVSNVTYADTIGDIDYGEPVVTPTPDVGSEATESFINTEQSQTTLADLNVDGTYNKMNVAPDYVNVPKVMEILHPEQVPEKKKNTFTITKEIKMIFVIALVLFAFIMLVPIVSELVDKIRFH